MYDLHICIIEGNIFAITIITTSKEDKEKIKKEVKVIDPRKVLARRAARHFYPIFRIDKTKF
ncbi:MAG: hypothetical protein WCB31_06360 [Nitrososphaeraceae archaeon]